MSSSLKGKQAWLSRQGNQLEEAISRVEESCKSVDTLSPSQAKAKIRKGIKELELRQTALETALNSFSSAADAANLAEENQERVQSNITAAHDIIIGAQNLSLALHLQLDEQESTKVVEAESSKAVESDAETKILPQLPSLQIPKFRGNLWEWDQFWGIFRTTIHERQISKIEKFTHLLEALQGPARDAIQNLQITAENYDLAVNLLQCRYGNEGAIIGHLVTALQSIRQPSPRLSDQGRILEKVTPLVSQLRQKGECVDTQQMKRTILGKFSEKIQRSVLKQLRHQGSDSNEQSWTTQQLLRCLQEYFYTEDMIQHAKGFSDENPRRNPNAVQPQKTSSVSVRTTPQSNVGRYLCFYCHRADHRPSACTKFSTYAQRIFSMCFLAAYTCFSKLRVKLTRRAQPTKFIALLFIICIAHLAQSCQDVDVFELRAITCIRSGDGNRTCAVDITQMLKMNTFHRETCFRLLTRDTLLKEIRLEWKRLQLICDRQTVMFTRHVIQQVIDSKRGPRTGKCKGRKCASVNTTSLVPELSQGNKFPEITHCVESCGGIGCGCFYPSSGCLFYRIYATPVNDNIYEIFRCLRWKEEVVLGISITEAKGETTENTMILQPTIPQNVGTMRITLVSVTVTPTPALPMWFITEGNNTARWTGSNIPTLECPSKKAAKVLDCEIHTNCRCQTAEDKMNCICTDTNITKDFNSELRNQPTATAIPMD